LNSPGAFLPEPGEATSSPFDGFRSGTARRFDRREPAVAWIMLIAAGLLEVVWAFSMKQSDGFTRLWPSVVTVVTMVLSFVLLAASMRSLPLGTAYTIWTGIGAVGAFIVGIMVLGETLNAARLVAALLIVSGLVLMKVTTDA
jgi:quaternary ammonium compound-resistance protein SugE